MLQINFDPTANPLNNNEWSFPLFECIHIAMFAMSIGTIALVDYRLFGFTLRKYSVAQLLKATSNWTLVGLIVVITSGFVIATTDPLAYYYNPAFRLKMLMLTLAILFNYTIHRKVAMSEYPAVVNVLTAAVSMAMWISVVYLGIFYAFV